MYLIVPVELLVIAALSGTHKKNNMKRHNFLLNGWRDRFVSAKNYFCFVLRNT